MNEKIKGLEKQIQTYIENHSDCEVTIDIERVVEFDDESLTQSGMKWVVTVEHSSCVL